ncbi:MAG: hypothetical protein A2049_03800 [Elusimicrobia bacterium GWA2_62_23]|nr:MAG: hypothetical protein A2049_03800 [Elusimicrobia bacterium GWA2_62_23]
MSNIGKDTQKLDVRRGGERMLQVRRIGAGFIAAEYLDCGNYVRAGEYYYRDWQDFKERREKWELEAAGDEYPLANYISVLEQMNRYSDAIKYYPEYLNEIRNRAELPKGVGAKEFREKSPVLADWYAEVDSAYRKAIMLSKTATPRPPDPAVQHHEWFYSGKPEEVLKSLDYYSQNKVQFMLEKALNHKNMAIAAKANEYLDNLTDSTDRGR